MDRLHTLCSSPVHHILSTLEPVIHRPLSSHKLRTQPQVIRQPKGLIQQHRSRPTTRVARTSQRQPPPSVTSRMRLRMSTMMMRPALLVAHRTGLEARSQTRRFVTPSSERFTDHTWLTSNRILWLSLLARESLCHFCHITVFLTLALNTFHNSLCYVLLV